MIIEIFFGFLAKIEVPIEINYGILGFLLYVSLIFIVFEWAIIKIQRVVPFISCSTTYIKRGKVSRATTIGLLKYNFYQIEHQLYFWSNDILFWGCLSRKLVVILIFIFVEENRFIKSLIVLFRLFFIHNCLVFLSFTGITTSQTFVSFGQSFSFVYKTFSNCKK